MSLGPQQRAVFSKREQVAILRDGMLAVDAAPIKEKLQVLDFLVAGDVVTAPVIQRAPGVSIRAITHARVILLDDGAIECEPRPEQYWASLFGRCQRQLARTNAHQLIVGHLETDARVASFILALALSRAPTQAPGLNVELPMSRDDIANYLVINSDTLSRTMMKFVGLGLIKRLNRHSIQVIELDRLRKLSPLSQLITAVFQNNDAPA
jgi:CRP-like cAMP-binding protein